ncbi:MAG: hypothetical protein CEE38_20875 [Planctomycetes bacterium B3_Pla]|nr:MAG: hypothetical protein CEE38_20875 [Planctomycetes bacterium B3_Pla]
MTELNEEKRFKGDMCMGILSTKHRSTELIATPDRLILKGPLRRMYELEAENVERIEKAGVYIWFLTGLIFGSIRIYHTIEGYPKRLMFTAWRVKADKLLEELKGLGYKIRKN